MVDTRRFSNENEEQYTWRLGRLKDSGLIDLSWDQIAEMVNKEFRDEDEYLGSSAIRKPYQYSARYYAAGVFNQHEDLDERKREIEKERKKLQLEKAEYTKWVREEARDELIMERIIDAVSNLEPLDIPDELPVVKGDKAWLLCFSDCHYGVEFQIKDIYGDIINEYSPEIFEKRMSKLLSNVIEKIDTLGINHLYVMELGDGIDGMLRLTSQLMKLRYGVIDSTVRYANYVANWLNVLSKYTKITFQMVSDSNHNQLRLLGAPKNAFVGENMSKVMISIIKERLKDNRNIKIEENPTGMPYATIAGYNVLGFHGEKKNLKKNLNEMSRIYGVDIDYTVSGHKHDNMSQEIGFDSEVFSVGSVVGADDYSLSLNASSNASASMYEFEYGNGRTAEYLFKLS